MRLIRGLILLGAVGVLAGCLPIGPRRMMGPVDEMLPPQPDRCGIAALPPLRGEKMERLADFHLSGPLRVLWPGQEITNEVQPDRLNAEVDVTGRIRRLVCG